MISPKDICTFWKLATEALFDLWCVRAPKREGFRNRNFTPRKPTWQWKNTIFFTGNSSSNGCFSILTWVLRGCSWTVDFMKQAETNGVADSLQKRVQKSHCIGPNNGLNLPSGDKTGRSWVLYEWRLSTMTFQSQKHSCEFGCFH